MTLKGRYRNIYNSWYGAMSRCRDKDNKDYFRYGGRGIKFDHCWDDFETFCEWALSHGWKRGLTIDRIDMNGDYTPSNCRWATVKEQNNNRRSNVFVTVNGERKTLRYWQNRTGIPSATMSFWMKKYGESETVRRIEKSLKEPYKRRKDEEGIAVRCIETNEEYFSLRECSRQIGVQRDTLRYRIRHNIPIDGRHYVTEEPA